MSNTYGSLARWTGRYRYAPLATSGLETGAGSDLGSVRGGVGGWLEVLSTAGSAQNKRMGD